MPGGDAVAAAWHARDVPLREYYDGLLTQRDPTNVLRTLLHEHHVRSLGNDPDFERMTNHAARAAAMRCLARAGAVVFVGSPARTASTSAAIGLAP